MKVIFAATILITSMSSFAMESGSIQGFKRAQSVAVSNGNDVIALAVRTQITPVSLYTMASLPDQIPEDLRDSVCGFDLDGTLTEPSPDDFKKRVAVEKGAPKVLKELAARGCTVIVITARVPGQRTFDELHEGGYDFFTERAFSRPIAFTNKVLFVAEHGNVEYRDGILFASNVNKGIAVKALISSADANPSGKIPANFIYVDDAVSESRNVIGAMAELGVNAYVFRYLAPGREHFEY